MTEAARRFDRQYYRRFYFDGGTAVTSRSEMQARARLIAAFAQHVGCPTQRVLDAGCGLGLMRAPLRRALPRLQYTGLEASEYLCKRYGWVRGSIATFAPNQAFDIVICYDVMQYLGDREAAGALRNLGRLCRGVLYFCALTRRDWTHNCDQRRTDSNVRIRDGNWYRQRLLKQFRPIGAGFWVRRGAPLVIWDLEMAPLA